MADIPEDTCSSEEERAQAEQACHEALHSEILSKCHGKELPQNVSVATRRIISPVLYVGEKSLEASFNHI